jgi:hypothetical protein
MSRSNPREHFVPLQKSELIELLCADESLPEEDRDRFRHFCRLLSATYHFHFNQRFEELKAAYAPFDPDRDTQPLIRCSAEERQQRINELYRDFAWLLDRGNFIHLSREDIEPSLQETSDWGIRVQVDFGAFEHLAIFARGDVLQKRTRRRLRKFYRLEETQVPTYQRLVMILKLKPEECQGRAVQADRVYLKIFKDIPKLDLKMLLPTARVRLSLFDRGRISFPLFSGLGAALLNIADDLFPKLLGFANNPTLLLWGIASGGIGYGYRSYYGYQQTKQRYNLTLTQSLYYQNLDSNAGVLFRLLDEAEEQECGEALMAYYFLWRHAPAQGWTRIDLQDFIELHLERQANIEVDVELDDAMAKLERLRLIEKNGEHYRARPMDKAIEMLDWTWDNYFKHNLPEPANQQSPER